jgi:transposase
MIGVYKKKKHLPKIRHIPGDLWNEVKNILPAEKQIETIGRPIVPFRKVLDGVLYVLGIGCQFEDVAKRFWFWSYTCNKRFQEWIGKGVFEKLWIRLLEVYNDIHGIEWGWMAVTR